MNFRKLSPVFLALAVALGAAGCGPGKAGGKKVIHYANGESMRTQIALTREIIKEFEKENPDVQVKFSFGDPQEKLLTMMASGTAPDVFAWLRRDIIELKERGTILPLDEYVKKFGVDLSEYFSCLIRYFTIDGELYGLPVQMNTDCLVYNKDMFDREKLPYPSEKWDWNDFLAAATKLTKDFNNDGLRDQFGVQMPYFDHWLLTNGGGVVDPVKKNCGLGLPQSREGLEFLLELYRKATPSQTDMENMAGGALTNAFCMEKVGMVVAPAWMLAGFNVIDRFTWDVAPLPKPPKRKRVDIYDGYCLCISNQSKYPEEAFRFMRFCTGERGMKIWARAKNGIPAHKKTAYEMFVTPPPDHLKYYLDAAERATVPVFPQIRNYTQASKAFEDQQHFLLLENRPVDEVVKAVEPKMNAILKGE